MQLHYHLGGAILNKMKEQQEYIILDKYKGCDYYTAKPDYDRKDGGKFVLNEDLSKKDLEYLYDVVKHEGIIKIPAKVKVKEETKAKKK